MPFHLERRLSFVSTQRTFEFLIHKPADTRRFDFYLGVRPYEVEALEHLAANVRAMYPESFHFEIVPFATTDIFVDDVEPAGATLADLAAFDGIDELVELDGFEPDLLDTAEDTRDESERGTDGDPTPPAMVRWEGVETKNNDWMTLLSQFSEISVDIEDSFRSPLSVLLEQATETDEPFIFQVVFTPRRDWTKEAEVQKRNLKMGTTGVFSSFKQEAAAMILGTSEEERRQRHRPDTPEQIGGTISGGGDGQSTRHSRMGQIDLKQPTVTFVHGSERAVLRRRGGKRQSDWPRVRRALPVATEPDEYPRALPEQEPDYRRESRRARELRYCTQHRRAPEGKPWRVWWGSRRSFTTHRDRRRIARRVRLGDVHRGG
jgi:hypothetical protein